MNHPQRMNIVSPILLIRLFHITYKAEEYAYVKFHRSTTDRTARYHNPKRKESKGRIIKQVAVDKGIRTRSILGIDILRMHNKSFRDLLNVFYNIEELQINHRKLSQYILPARNGKTRPNNSGIIRSNKTR